jgi:hypothetical protein
VIALQLFIGLYFLAVILAAIVSLINDQSALRSTTKTNTDAA